MNAKQNWLGAACGGCTGCAVPQVWPECHVIGKARLGPRKLIPGSGNMATARSASQHVRPTFCAVSWRLGIAPKHQLALRRLARRDLTSRNPCFVGRFMIMRWANVGPFLRRMHAGFVGRLNRAGRDGARSAGCRRSGMGASRSHHRSPKQPIDLAYVSVAPVAKRPCSGGRFRLPPVCFLRLGWLRRANRIPCHRS